MDQPQPHPGPHTAEHPHAQHTDEEHRIGVVAEGQQPLGLPAGTEPILVETSAVLAPTGYPPISPRATAEAQAPFRPKSGPMTGSSARPS